MKKKQENYKHFLVVWPWLLIGKNLTTAFFFSGYSFLDFFNSNINQSQKPKILIDLNTDRQLYSNNLTVFTFSATSLKQAENVSS